MQYPILAAVLMASAPLTPLAAQQDAAPKAVAKADFVKGIEATFSAVDTNKDGFLDRTEIEASENKAMAARKVMVIKSREEAFKQLDKDNNGSLTLAEFNAVAQSTAPPKADAAPLLARLDANKDGKISAAEHRTPAVAQFDRTDANKDGTVTAAEDAAARRAR